MGGGQRGHKETKEVLGPPEQELWMFMNLSIWDEDAGILTLIIWWIS